MSTTNILDLNNRIDELADEVVSKMQEKLSVYTTTRYNGTTSSVSTTVASISLPAGEYIVVPTGYVNSYGAIIAVGTTEYYAEETGKITVSATTTVNIRPTGSDSTTWTNYSIRFIKIS